MKKQGQIFCNGLFCRKGDRKLCKKCGQYACSSCSRTTNGRSMCVDCYVEIEIKSQWNELLEELTEQYSFPIIKKKITK